MSISTFLRPAPRIGAITPGSRRSVGVSRVAKPRVSVRRAARVPKVRVKAPRA